MTADVPTRRSLRPLKVLVVVGIVVWCALSWWNLRQAQEAGDLLVDTLETTWPEDGSPQLGTRAALVAASEKLRDGEFRSAVASLRPAEPLTDERRAAAGRFFAKTEHQEHRDRFLAAVVAAQAEEQDGADVAAVRAALDRALGAAARADERTVTGQISLAEDVLGKIAAGVSAGSGAIDAETVAAAVVGIEPAFSLGRRLMTEGHAAVEKLVARASRHYRAGEFRLAVSLVDMAADLLAVDRSARGTAADVPDWFKELAAVEPAVFTQAEATAAVELCRAMAVAEEPADTVAAMVAKAGRQLDAGRFEDAGWWAAVALGALGMTDRAVADAVRIEEADSTQ